MPKARRKKETSFTTSPIKSVFLYGEPNNGKLSRLKKAHEYFLCMVNGYIYLLDVREKKIFNYLLMGTSKAPEMRVLEKELRPCCANCAYSQAAFDMAVTYLSNRLNSIRISMLSCMDTVFVRSKVLFAMSAMGKGRMEMVEALSSLKKKEQFHFDCVRELQEMDEEEFAFSMREFMDCYTAYSLEYKVPMLKSIEIPLDKNMVRIEQSENIKAPYVLYIADPLERNSRICVPVQGSRKGLERIRAEGNTPAGTVSVSIKGKKLKASWACKKKVEQPETSGLEGVDTGMTDTFCTSSGNTFGSMKPVIDYYKETVEPLFGEISRLRDKKRNICRYLHDHKDLPEDVRRSHIQKIDRLEKQIREMKKPYRKLRCYYGMLDHAIAEAVDGYIASISRDTLTVLELLDIKEFNKSRKANGMMSVFARGKAQKRLMEQLNWNGFDFLEVDPAYTSQACPVCFSVDKASRNGKAFKCVCCGHEDDADHNASVNIKHRAEDKEIHEICEKYRYSTKKRHEALKMLYKDRNAEYKKQHSQPEKEAPAGAS